MDKRKLYFYEDEHKYFDDLDRQYISVTTLLHNYVPPFERHKMARHVSKQNKGMYKGKSAGEIINMWDGITDKALKKGNAKHTLLETGIKESNFFRRSMKTLTYRDDSSNRIYTIDDIMKDHDYGILNVSKFKDLTENRYPKIYEAVKYYTDRGYRAYPELGIYNSDYLISGLIDLPLINFDTGLFVVFDWKTNKREIKFESGYYKKDKELQLTSQWVKTHKYLLAPLDSLEHCTGSIYTMQLSTYSRLLEYFGLRCEGIILAHIRDTFVNNKYGMPFRDSSGDFVVDKEHPETIDLHWIPYWKQMVDNMINHHYNKSNGAYGDNYTLKFK